MILWSRFWGPRSPFVDLRFALALVVAGVAFGAAAQSVPLVDSAGGATCQFFNASALLSWNHAGGDWIDAAGQPQGEAPFAEVNVSEREQRQLVVLDATTLVRAWIEGHAASGSMLLRSLPPGAGVVNFDSRRNADASTRPGLALHWADGRSDRLAASADTYFPCPSYGSNGSEPIFKVNRSWNALLVFPFKPAAGTVLRSATLTLSSGKQYAGGTKVGLFGVLMPQPPAAMLKVGKGLSAATLYDGGLEDLPGVYYVQRFDSRFDWLLYATDLRTLGNLRRVTSDAGNGFEPLDGAALAVTLERGNSMALNYQIRFKSLIGHDPEEAYFRYYLRLGENWDPVVDGGKLPGFAGTYGRAGWGLRAADGTNGWTARGGFFRIGAQEARDSDLRPIGTYADVADSTDYNGSSWGWNLGPTGMLHKNRWYSIEQHVKMNTPGRRDGVLEVWIDGQPAFSKTDIVYRTVPELKIESVWLNVYHGGTSAPDRDLTLYLDDIVIADRYIGPGNFPR